MLTDITQSVINNIKAKAAVVSKNLQNQQLFFYESGTSCCVIALIDNETLEIKATHAFNANYVRDLVLARGFLSLVNNLNTVPVKKIA